MKFTINKRLAALVLATSVAVSQFQTVVYATNSLNVNNKKPGSYKVTYTATDKEGESTNLDVNVIVEEVQQSVSNPVMTVTNKNIQPQHKKYYK